MPLPFSSRFFLHSRASNEIERTGSRALTSASVPSFLRCRLITDVTLQGENTWKARKIRYAWTVLLSSANSSSRWAENLPSWNEAREIRTTLVFASLTLPLTSIIPKTSTEACQEQDKQRRILSLSSYWLSVIRCRTSRCTRNSADGMFRRGWTSSITPTWLRESAYRPDGPLRSVSVT